MTYGVASLTFTGARRGIMGTLVPCRWTEMKEGLQKFAGLGPRQGMVFPSGAFPAPESIAMWMATVSFPLAMIWVDDRDQVGAIELVEPGDQRTFAHQGRYVVETNEAFVDDIGLRVGDGVSLRWQRPCPASA